MTLLTLCRYPGCRKLINYGQTYCDEHKNYNRDAERKNATERGYTYKWRKASKKFLEQHPLCVRCEAKGIVRLATVVDHIKPHKGNQKLFWDVNNWQPLCKQCHDRKTATEDSGFARHG